MGRRIIDDGLRGKGEVRGNPKGEDGAARRPESPFENRKDPQDFADELRYQVKQDVDVDGGRRRSGKGRRDGSRGSHEVRQRRPLLEEEEQEGKWRRNQEEERGPGFVGFTGISMRSLSNRMRVITL